MNIQAIAHPDGMPLWLSPALPGRAHDPTAARAHGIVQACLARQVLVLADKLHRVPQPGSFTPYYQHRELPEHYKRYNRVHARKRAFGERAFTLLKSWRMLRRARYARPLASD